MPTAAIAGCCCEPPRKAFYGLQAATPNNQETRCFHEIVQPAGEASSSKGVFRLQLRELCPRHLPVGIRVLYGRSDAVGHNRDAKPDQFRESAVQALVCVRDSARRLRAHGKRRNALFLHPECFCINRQNVAETFFAGTEPPAFEQERRKLDSTGRSLGYPSGA
jgi:hypothetical protein